MEKGVNKGFITMWSDKHGVKNIWSGQKRVSQQNGITHEKRSDKNIGPSKKKK